MKILFCASSFQVGITCLLTEHLCALKQTAGPEVELLAIAGEGEQEPGLEQRLITAGITVKRIIGFDHHHNFFRLLRELTDAVKSFHPDVVMAQTNWQFVLLDLVRIKTGASYPLIYWIHGYRHNSPLKAKFALPLIGLGLRFRAQAVIASSQTVLLKFSPWTGKQKIHDLPLGVDDVFFEKKAEAARVIPPCPRLIFAGQFREGKQQDWIISAVYAYHQKGHPVEVYLPGDGPLRQKIQEQTEQLGLRDLVHLPGSLSRSEIAELYRQATLAIVPSNDETFGACIAEPLVCGIPLLTRPVGCAVKLIRPDENGFLFSTREELQTQLHRILTNPVLYQKVAKNLDSFRTFFNWQEICKKELILFQKILSKQHSCWKFFSS